MQSKNELRIFAKNTRNNLNMSEISKCICDCFIKSDYYKKSKNIAIYYPIGSEINCLSLLNDTDKNFFIPKVKNQNDMIFTKYNLNDKLINNCFGIPETLSDNANYDFDIMILPALMADKNGYRLGYGKGYYDKFISTNNIKAKKIIFIPEILITEKLPIDEFDIPADIIISEKNIYTIR